MTTLIEILKQKEGEALLLGQLRGAYEATRKVEQKDMLHADDDAFGAACGLGYLAIVEWLWGICPDLEKPAMLCKDNYAFLVACHEGRLEIAHWLWKVCPDREQSAMCMLKIILLFVWLVGKGHLAIAEWLWSICPEQEQSAMLNAKIIMRAFLVACHEEEERLEITHWLWTICPDEEQSAMLHVKDNYAFRLACRKGHQKVAEWLWKVCLTWRNQQCCMLTIIMLLVLLVRMVLGMAKCYG